MVNAKCDLACSYRFYTTDQEAQDDETSALVERFSTAMRCTPSSSRPTIIMRHSASADSGIEEGERRRACVDLDWGSDGEDEVLDLVADFADLDDCERVVRGGLHDDVGDVSIVACTGGVTAEAVADDQSVDRVEDALEFEGCQERLDVAFLESVGLQDEVDAPLMPSRS